jgi:hypothetical protein
LFCFFIGGGGAKAIPASLGKSVLNSTYCIGKTLEFRAEAFRYGILIANTICNISISLTFVEYHKARPHERSSYWSIIYNWCVLSYVSPVKCSHLSFVLFSNFQASYKFDPELFLNCESQLKFLERKNGEDNIWCLQIFVRCSNCVWDSR